IKCYSIAGFVELPVGFECTRRCSSPRTRSGSLLGPHVSQQREGNGRGDKRRPSVDPEARRTNFPMSTDDSTKKSADHIRDNVTDRRRPVQHHELTRLGKGGHQGCRHNSPQQAKFPEHKPYRKESEDIYKGVADVDTEVYG